MEEPSAGEGGLAATVHAYASMSFLYHMFVIFIALCTMMLLWGALAPGDARPLPRTEAVEMTPMRGLRPASIALLASVVALYLVFW